MMSKKRWMPKLLVWLVSINFVRWSYSKCDWRRKGWDNLAEIFREIVYEEKFDE